MALMLVDGKEVAVKQGETILQACMREGIEIPYFCYHPSLSIVGQCRMCLVKVEGAPKLLTACTTVVPELAPDKKIDGRYDMKVSAACEEVKEAQRGIMEFLLANHPLDCPVCDQAGECRLQEYSYDYGAPRSEFVFEKVHAPKRIDLGPHIVYDAERCIKCTRCVRFCAEITGTSELSLVERGVSTIVGTFEGGSLDNPYSICTADLCPVGALTYREFRFRERVWFLQAHNSVCPECSRNCSVRVDSYKGEVLRLVPRYNPSVNGYYMCDHGRLITERLKGRETRDLPCVRRDGKLESMSEQVFYDRLAGLFAEKKYQPGQAAVILSGRMSLEEMVAYKRLSKEIFGAVVGDVLLRSGKGDELLVRKEKRPNYEGALKLSLPLTSEDAAVEKLIGGKKALLIIREDPFGEASQEERKKLEAAIGQVETVVVMDDHLTATAAFANYFVPLAGWFEMEGTTVNFKGHLQKTARCVAPPQGRRPFYDVVAGFLKAMGMEAPAGFRGWFEEVRKEIPVLGIVKAGGIPLKGIPLPEKKEKHG